MPYNQLRQQQELMHSKPLAQEKKYPVDVDGKVVELSESKIGELIKKKLKESRAILQMLKQFEISPDRLDKLTITIEPLDKKYAETDLETMKLNTTLFEEGRFFRDHFFVVCHELTHWCCREKENDAMLNDPEEVAGFCASIAYEIEQGSDIDEIYNKVYPKINWHFHNESDAREFFENMLEKALKMLKE